MWIDDVVLKACHKQLHTEIWIPQKPLVVLGSSNRAEIECHEDNCIQDQVPILKRYGGGGTVVLYPGCLVVSIGTWVKQAFANNIYFDLLNSAVICSLAAGDERFAELDQGGISDIKFRDKKIAGTSLFRSRNYLLYQASILVNVDFAMIDKYLAHPSKEPSYRQGRSHKDFLTALDQITPQCSPNSIRNILETHLVSHTLEKLAEEFILPQSAQYDNLLKRLDM